MTVQTLLSQQNISTDDNLLTHSALLRTILLWPCSITNIWSKSEEAKFLTVSMAAFRDNKQALYGIFQCVRTRINPPQNRITITELLHNRLQAIKYKKGMFFLSQPWLYPYVSEHLMIRFSELVEIRVIRAFFNYFRTNSEAVSSPDKLRKEGNE